MSVRATGERVPFLEPARHRPVRPPEVVSHGVPANIAWDEATSLAWVLRASGLGHWRHRIATDTLECSEGCRRILGLGPNDELTSLHHLMAYVHPDDGPTVERARERALDETGEYEVEHRLVLRSGDVRWVSVRGRVCRCPEGGAVMTGLVIDITAQKAAEAERERLLAELAAERARLQTLVEHMPAAVVMADASGDVVLANRAVETVFPMPAPAVPIAVTELLDLWRARHPDGRFVETADRPLFRALRGERVDGQDYRYLRDDGTETWLRVSSAPIRDAGGAVTGGVVIAASVDRERRAEADLRASERRLRHLFESPVIGVLHARTDGRILEANDTFLRTFGHGREDLEAGRLDWRDFTPESYREADDRRIATLLTEGSYHVAEKEYFHKDGTRIPVCIGGTMIEGTADETVTFILDIRDRKRAEAERERLVRSLAESEERYRLAALASDDAIYDWDLRTESVSHRTMFGRGHDDVMSCPEWANRIHPEDRSRVLTELRAAIARGEQHWQAEYRFRTTSGEWGVVADRGYLVFDEDGKPARMVGAMQDVTARRRQEEFERQLIGIVSHDLRNPLSTIVFAAGMMETAAEHARDERLMKNVRRVQTAADRATRMIHDLLDFTRARLGTGIPVHRRRVRLTPLLQTLIDELRVGHPRHRIAFEASGDCTGDFDADRLSQVLTNLLENGLKYSPEDSTVTVELGRTPDRDHAVRLSVHNHGPAIPPDLLPRIFEPLQRGEPAFDRSGRSVGLGLYIVKRLVEAHGGTVTASSSSAEGTRFDVVLPCDDDADLPP